MSLRGFLEQIWRFLREKLVTLNVFDSKSRDPTIIRREILSTRLFILLLAISIFILTGYTLFSLQYKNETIDKPTQSTYKQLQIRYPDSLQCPCEKVSVSFGEFVNIIPRFHQVCSSDFVSQIWIDYVFLKNSSLTWPIDVRISLSTMWQLIRTLCQNAIDITTRAFDQFFNTLLINSVVLSEELLKAQVQANLNSIIQTTSSTFLQSMIAVHRITQVNELTTALLTNYIAVTTKFGQFFLTVTINDFDITVGMTGNKYIFNNSIRYCSCRNNGSCPMPGNVYLYTVWEKYGVYDFTIIKANKTIPGIIIDCLPIQTVLASTLQCFYDQSCLNLLISIYQKSIHISILNISIPSRFFPTTNIELLINELFIEEINNEIIHYKYYNECSPIYCEYSYSRRFDIVYVVTTFIAVFGGLSTALRLITPYLITLILLIKNYRCQRIEREEIEHQLTIQTRIKNLISNIKNSLINLNLFDSHSRDQLRIFRERISTWLFIIFFIGAMSSLIFYACLLTQNINKIVRSPTQNQYEDLLYNYETKLQCPCTIISIPYKEFIQISPIYHQICQSDFVQSWWYKSLTFETTADLSLEFLPTVSSYFRSLSTFCEIANSTVTEAIRQFSNTLFVNAQIITLNSFTSQTNALINTFQEITRNEFLYTMSLTNALLDANQYVSNKMANTILSKWYYPELAQTSLGSVRIYTTPTVAYYDDGNLCACPLDSTCEVEDSIFINGNAQDFYSELPGIIAGCFTVNSVLKSSLICWYTYNCTKNLQNLLKIAGAQNLPNVNVLNSQVSSKFPQNISTEVIFNEMMIERWISSTSYENFYQKCKPAYCSYSYDEGSDILFIITTVIGFMGGLNVILRLISPLLSGMLFRCINRQNQNILIQTVSNRDRVHQNRFIRNTLPNVWSQFRDNLAKLNTFDSESNDVHTIKRERFSTRIYLISLIICIVIVTMATLLSEQTLTSTISFPSQIEYENLLLSHSYTYQCPCSQVSVPHKYFITINATFHQVCSSEFVQYNWLTYLIGYISWSDYEIADIRGRGAAYFFFLSALCKLSQKTVSNMILQFHADTFISAQAIPESKFYLQIDTVKHRFQTVTPERFSHTLTFMNEIAQSSNLVSSYFLNWYWWTLYNSSMATLPIRDVILNNSCSCGTQNDCIQSGGIYESFTNIQHFAIPGWYIGCSVVDTLLRSTLECFYNQSCIDLLMYYIITVEQTYPITWEIPPLIDIASSRFKADTVIQEIVDKLFVEQWTIDASYSAFYNQCAPAYCSYTFKEGNDIGFIVARILGIYGGLTIVLRFIAPLLVTIFFKIRNRFCRNMTNPLA